MDKQAWIKKEAFLLIISSFLLLFIELVLMRLLGSHILHVSFFSNFVLLASFLGIGIGFLHNKNKLNWFYISPLVLGILFFLSYQLSFNYDIHLNAEQNDLDYHIAFLKKGLSPIFLSLPIIFLLVCFTMASVADLVSRFFEKLEPLDAYRLNIVGSLLGIIVFSIFAFLHISPFGWGITIILLYSIIFILLSKKNLILMLIYLSMTGLVYFFVNTSSQDTYWSPYYRITLKNYLHDRYVVNVNGLPQQNIESVEQRKKLKPFYFIPYDYKPSELELNHVLIVGAGTGGDVAIALSKGAKEIDAVEIDPILYQLGKKFNPNHPFNDARVHVYITDGRAFLENHSKQYDMIIYALPDSVMLVSGQSSLRLENYLFTLEGISAVYQHLKPGGIFSFYNYMNEAWAIERLANTLSIAFKKPPCIDINTINGMETANLSISRDTNLACDIWQVKNTQYISPSTDDHPFIHLKDNAIPGFYLYMLFFIGIVSIFILKMLNGGIQVFKGYLDFFCMGAAFILLETKSIVNEALLFGTTWFVNATVFIGILITVYLSVEFTSRIKRIQPMMLYGLLLVTLFIAWIFPIHFLLSLSLPIRYICATLLGFTPIFFANIIFAERFRNTTQSKEAFAANMMGGVFGGLLEYTALIYGYRNLLIIVALLYLIGLVAMPYFYRIKNAY